MKKWRTEVTRCTVHARIHAVEVERESDTFVWIKGGREKKQSEYQCFHDSWEAAHQHLLAAAEQQAAAARLALERANGALGNVKGMKKPEEVPDAQQD